MNSEVRFTVQPHEEEGRWVVWRQHPCDLEPYCEAVENEMEEAWRRADFLCHLSLEGARYPADRAYIVIHRESGERNEIEIHLDRDGSVQSAPGVLPPRFEIQTCIPETRATPRGSSFSGALVERIIRERQRDG